MDMLSIIELSKVYALKVKEENYTNTRTMDIYMCTRDLIKLESMIGSEADILTWGEFTRRFNSTKEELQGLLKA